MAAHERVQLRRAQSRPLLAQLLWALRSIKREHILVKSTLAQAVSYTLKLWSGLSMFTRDGHIEIDNNPVENAIRPVALGRKNYLFAGSHAGAERSGMFYSLFAACKTHNINPQEWLQYVIENIADTKLSNLHHLLPQNYAALQGK
ncbi:MAG: hypothetical protein RL660_1863 [Bacteroidota bacterium]